MKKRSVIRGSVTLALALAVSMALQGCSSGAKAPDCKSEQDYQVAEQGRDLTVPAGFDAPDKATKFVIPSGPLPTEPLANNAACLPQPPNYFDKPLQPEASLPAPK